MQPVIIYLVLVDSDGMIRSSCDEPVAAFTNKEDAETHAKNIKDNKQAYDTNVKQIKLIK